jgi:hypothetical protein
MPAMKTFLLVLLAVVFLVQIALGVMWALRVRDEARIGALWATLRKTVGAAETFAPSSVEGLPEIARRYFAHAIAPGAPLPRVAELRMTGSIAPDGKTWMPLTADQVLAPGRGFIWRAQVKAWGPVTLRGIDHFADGEGRMLILVQGLAPMVNRSGPDLAKSAAGRLLIESTMLPPALLPSRGATWEEVDRNHARVRVKAGDLAATLTLAIDDEGRLKSAVVPRWKEVGNGRWETAPFGVFVEDEAVFEGIAVPTRIRGGWWPGSPQYAEFARFEIGNVTFP